ncbi:hypothetical protein [Microbacterium sp.]|uniref:hypothetical protein n=1 Tax=Microbacterium sp. TaxID=51671 RepID=UPI003F9D3A94
MSKSDGWSRMRASGAAVAGAALALGLVSVSVQSYAAVAEPADAARGDLIVDAQPHPTEFFDLSPGEIRYWSIEASLEGAERGSLALRVFGAGALIQHPQHPLMIAVDGCDGTLVGDDPRERPACQGADYTTVVAQQPLADITSDPSADETDDVWTLRDITSDEGRSFVVTLAVPAGGADDKTLMGLRGEIGVGLFSAGDDIATPEKPIVQEPDLATTGGLLPISLALIGAGTIGLGLVLGRVHSSRRRQASGRTS